MTSRSASRPEGARAGGRRTSLRTKLALLCAVGGLGAGVVAWAAWTGLGEAEAGLGTQVRGSAALRNHLEADMMHDALRGDVLAALLAATPDERDAVRTDLGEHAELFREAVAANQELELPAAVDEALRALDEPLDAYIASAEEIVGVALDDRAAGQARLPIFLDDFGTLEGAMGDASDVISEHAAAAEAEAADEVAGARQKMLLVLGLVAVALAALSVVMARRLTRPLLDSVRSLEALAAKDLTARLELATNDETADMARALNSALASLSEAMSAIDGSSATLASASEELLAVSGEMAVSAHDTDTRSSSAVAIGEEVSTHMASVSAAVEELGASVEEIARSTSEASAVVEEAVTLAHRADEEVVRLGEASAAIGSVVQLITSIAEQTNLLALNATIEAARAGELGKGFAVVAHEVKELANETSKATDEIAHQVGTIQAETSEAVDAIRQIASSIERMNEYQQGISSAIEEQAATTREIGRSIGEAAQGASEIAASVTSMSEAARVTAEGVGSTQDAARDLERVATTLKDLVGQFRY